MRSEQRNPKEMQEAQERRRGDEKGRVSSLAGRSCGRVSVEGDFFLMTKDG